MSKTVKTVLAPTPWEAIKALLIITLVGSVVTALGLLLPFVSPVKAAAGGMTFAVALLGLYAIEVRDVRRDDRLTAEAMQPVTGTADE